MTASRDDPGDGADARALVIGNSYAGALVKAAALAPAGSPWRRFHFAAAGGANFRRIGVAEGRLTSVRALRDELLPLACYRAIFIYGDLPHVVDLVAARRKLAKRNYSRQVVERALGNLVAHSASVAVRRLVAAASSARVLLLPANPSVASGPSRPEEREQAAALIPLAAGGEVLPSPPELLDPDGLPVASFYKGSVGITGELVADDAQAKHDLFHYNAKGGAAWLAAMTAVMGEG